MMLEREQRIEAERLGEVAHRQMVVDDRDIGAAGLGQHVECNTDFHVILPRARQMAIPGRDRRAVKAKPGSTHCAGAASRRNGMLPRHCGD